MQQTKDQLREFARRGLTAWQQRVLLTVSLALLGQPAMSAQGTLPSTSAIETAAKTLAAARLSDNELAAAEANLAAARAEADLADALMEQIAEQRSAAAGLPRKIASLRRAIEVDREDTLETWAARLPRSADSDTLERVLEQERNIIEGLNADIKTQSDKLAKLLSGPAAAVNEIATLRHRVEELQQVEARQEGEAPARAQIREARRLAELRRTQTELELRLLEQETSTQRQRAYELSISELTLRAEMHSRRIDYLQNEIANLGRRALEGLLEHLKAQRQAMPDPTRAPGRLAMENVELGQELIRQNQLLAEDRERLAASEQAQGETRQALQNTQARIDFGARNEDVGRWLWAERRQIESRANLDRQLNATRDDLAGVRLRLITISDETRALLDPHSAARQLIDAAPKVIENEGQSTVALTVEGLMPLLADRAGLLTQLEALLQRRASALDGTEQALDALVDDAVALRRLLDRHLLWIPSHHPVNTGWFARVSAGFADLFKAERYAASAELAWVELRNRPLHWGLTALLVLGLMELRRRSRTMIEREVPVARPIRKDTYAMTLRAFAWTVLAALPIPALLFWTGSLLKAAGEPGRFSDSLGRATLVLVIPVLATQLLSWTSIERGLGHAHFRWVRPRRQAIRQLVRPTVLVMLPLLFLSWLSFYRNLELANEVPTRVCIVLFCLLLAGGLWLLLAPGKIWSVRGADLEPSGIRRSLRVALPVLAILVGYLTLAGYIYSAGLMTIALAETFAALVAISVITGMLGRWLLLGERKLALARREEQHAAVLAREETSTAGAAAATPPEQEPELTLEQINAQTGRLLRAFRVTLVMVGLFWVWSDIMPAFARLDDVSLWHIADLGPDGTDIRVPVTVMAVILGTIALLLTAIGARNLPALIEIGLLSRTHIDAASRYAITSILRYAIVITGTVIGLSQFGLRWSQLQWLAAALTVGLGFGLQEIFANFVSGIILLFERPFRVGDTITVDNLSGRVTRIRTRATTIVDFENKEIVVPNKNFITGQLLNWTLSDTTTRVTITIGVDYGTNPRLVLDLLNQAAAEHPLVLKDPEPQSWFLEFGANSLDFELRVFVANLQDRLVAKNALNIRITELFETAGINIAFPQLDIHIRDLPTGFGGGPEGITSATRG